MPATGPSTQSIWPYSHIYSARLPVRAKRAGRLAFHHVVAAAAGGQADMDAVEPAGLRLQVRRQRVVGGGAIGEQRLALALRRGDDGKEQRYVGRRAPVALVGVPAAPVRELHRQAPVRGQWRIGAA